MLVLLLLLTLLYLLHLIYNNLIFKQYYIIIKIIYKYYFNRSIYNG